MQTLKPCLCGKTPRVERKKGMAGITKVPFYREQIVCRCGVSSKLFKAPNKAVEAWNTRPAAPVVGLETYMRADFGTVDLVTRPQAEAIIAALQSDVTGSASVIEHLTQRAEKAEADNAALTARVKELEADVSAYILSAEDQDKRRKALETQLAAARKALEGIDSIITNSISENGSDHHRMKIGDIWYEGPPVDALHRILMGMRQVARAALEASYAE